MFARRGGPAPPRHIVTERGPHCADHPIRFRLDHNGRHDADREPVHDHLRRLHRRHHRARRRAAVAPPRRDPLILEHDPDQLTPAAAGQLLIPWPNRIDHGEYTFDGTAQKLPITEAALDNAIHGLTRWESWSLLEITESAVTLGHRLLGRPGYPFRLDLTARYALAATAAQPVSTLNSATAPGLTVTITATNRGPVPAPYGHGAHPYLTVGIPVDECTVSLPTTHYQPVDPRMIPSGPPLPVSQAPPTTSPPRSVRSTSTRPSPPTAQPTPYPSPTPPTPRSTSPE